MRYAQIKPEIFGTTKMVQFRVASPSANQPLRSIDNSCSVHTTITRHTKANCMSCLSCYPLDPQMGTRSDLCRRRFAGFLRNAGNCFPSRKAHSWYGPSS